MSIDYSRMIKEKVTIVGRLANGDELWRMIGDAKTKYSASRSVGAGLVRYYNGRGAQIKHRSEFKTVGVGDAWLPESEWVAKFSVKNNGALLMTHRQVVEKARSLELFFDMIIDRVVVGNKAGSVLNKELVDSLEMSDFTINYTTGGFTIKGITDRNVSLEENVRSLCQLMRPQIDESMSMLKFVFAGRASELAVDPAGQELMDYVFGKMVNILGLDYDNMKHIRDRFMTRLQSGMELTDGEWLQDAYRVITQEIWDNMKIKPTEYTLFVDRALIDHIKVEYIESNASGSDIESKLNVLKTVKYDGQYLKGAQLREHVVNHILNTPYWHCGDERSSLLFLDFRIGLTDEEKEQLHKDTTMEEQFRELAIARWDALFERFVGNGPGGR